MGHPSPAPPFDGRKARALPKDVWGPLAWHWLHTQAINYPAHPSKVDQVAMLARFWSFIQTLPCSECRDHAAQYARDYPPDFSGTDRFQTWAWRFHNAVNHWMKKPLMTSEEYREAYAEERAHSYWRFL